MREATDGKYPRYAVWENVCFDADTLVTCEDGYKRIADISVGEKVKTLSGRYLPVMKVHQTKKQEVIRVSAQGGEDIIVTPNHPFYALRKIKKKGCIQQLIGPDWVTAGELTKDHLIAYGIDRPSLPEDFISEAEAWAVGRWLADGSVDLKKSNPRLFFSIGTGKEDLARKMLGILPYAVYENKPHQTATNFCFTSKEFYALISEAGIGAGNKRVPPYVFQLPFRLQKAVLDGYISGDGYVRIREHGREMSASTASRELAYGIARLVRNVYRVAVNISVKNLKTGSIDGRMIQPNYPSYQIEACLDSLSQKRFADETIIWQPVKSIEKLPGKRTVYNLSVLEDNTYAANDTIVHNCGAFSSNGGDDFRAVLEAVIGIKEEEVQVPAPEDHRWPKADLYLGDGWSLAYRVFDAQYWAVPQRRARIYLICDFAGGSAPEILFVSDGLSGYSPQGISTWKGTATGAEESTGETGRGADPGSGRGDGGVTYCANTQGSSGISITEEKTNTLVSQDHGNHPAVLQAAGFSTEHSAKARSIGYGEEVSPTLRAAQVPAAMSLQHNPSDSRLKIEKDGKVQTLCGRAGTGGNNVPLIAEPKSYGIAKEAFNAGEQAGFAFAVNEETSPTLQARGPGAVAKPEIKAFGVCGKSSYAMLSDNPYSGFYEAKTSRTLDRSGGNAVCSNQGGICVVAPAKEEAIAFEPGAASRVGGHVYVDGKAGTLRARAGDNQQAVVFFTQNQRNEVRDLKDRAAALQAQPGIKQQTFVLQGSMIGRKEKNGPQGDGINEDVSFTLTGADRHAVAAPSGDHYSASKSSFFTNALKEQAGALVASDWKDPPCVNDTPNEELSYIVRRLTPVECARLQAFPDWWCEGLEDPDPTEEELAFWMDVWEEWQRINGKKPKTEKQVRKWLADPHTDSAEYKLWGNGICLNNALFVLAGIVWAINKEASSCD